MRSIMTEGRKQPTSATLRTTRREKGSGSSLRAPRKGQPNTILNRRGEATPNLFFRGKDKVRLTSSGEEKGNFPPFSDKRRGDSPSSQRKKRYRSTKWEKRRVVIPSTRKKKKKSSFFEMGRIVPSYSPKGREGEGGGTSYIRLERGKKPEQRIKHECKAVGQARDSRQTATQKGKREDSSAQ